MSLYWVLAPIFRHVQIDTDNTDKIYGKELSVFIGLI